MGKILSVDQWGDISWTSMESAFQGCYSLNFSATDLFLESINLKKPQSILLVAFTFKEDKVILFRLAYRRPSGFRWL